MNKIKNSKRGRKETTSPNAKDYWVIYVFAFLTCFMAMFGVGAVSFDNIINDSKFFIVFALAGILVSIILFGVMFSAIPNFRSHEKKANYVSTSLIFIGLTILVPEISAYINDKFSTTSICSDYVIQRKSSGGNRTKAYWLFVNIYGKEERIELSRKKWEQYNEGGWINLCIAKGYLGFELINIK